VGAATVEGIERAVFGEVPEAAVDAWLDRHLRARLGTGLAGVLFRSGRVSAVYGLRLDDGRDVALKVHRGTGADVDTRALGAAVAAQRLLAGAGYPCPEPLDGPAATEGHTAVVEALLVAGEPGDAHRPGVRRAIAVSLAEQVELLRSLPDAVRLRLTDPPAWAVYAGGPWPAPHDPIFDFTTTSPDTAWIDDLARRAAAVLTSGTGRTGAPVTGHSDWCCGNLRFAGVADGPVAGCAVVASYDWDSVVTDAEPVVLGMAAASFTDSSTSGAQAPTPAEAAAFCAEYDAARGRPSTVEEQALTAAATAWTLAYNARCQVDVQRLGYDLPEGPVLAVLDAAGEDFLHLRW
jgi:hypothetical protein